MPDEASQPVERSRGMLAFGRAADRGARERCELPSRSCGSDASCRRAERRKRPTNRVIRGAAPRVKGFVLLQGGPHGKSIERGMGQGRGTLAGERPDRERVRGRVRREPGDAVGEMDSRASWLRCGAPKLKAAHSRDDVSGGCELHRAGDRAGRHMPARSRWWSTLEPTRTTGRWSAAASSSSVYAP
jgi:hypothetical protein